MSVTETNIVTALDSDVSLRADVAVELSAIIVVYTTHRYDVLAI